MERGVKHDWVVFVLFSTVCVCMYMSCYICVHCRPEEDIGCFTLELFTLVYKIPYLSVYQHSIPSFFIWVLEISTPILLLL